MTRLNANKRRIELARKYTVHSRTEPGKGLVIKGSAKKKEEQYTDHSKAIIYHYQQFKQVNQQIKNLQNKKDIILEKYLLPFIYQRMAWMRHRTTNHQIYKAEELQDLIELFGSKEDAYTFRKKYLSYKL